jgi:hypothetical protein
MNTDLAIAIAYYIAVGGCIWLGISCAAFLLWAWVEQKRLGKEKCIFKRGRSPHPRRPF